MQMINPPKATQYTPFSIPESIRKAVSQAAADPKGKAKIFDEFMTVFADHHALPAGCLDTVKARDAHLKKGIAFERFTQMWLVATQRYVRAWLWAEIPEEVRRATHLDNFPARQDNGIDLVVQDESGRYSAVQCKYKKSGSLGWNHLGTFYGMCARTGPWTSHIVATNSCNISSKPRRMRQTDILILRKHFRETPQAVWDALSGSVGQVLDASPTPSLVPETPTDLRQARIEHFERAVAAVSTKPPAPTLEPTPPNTSVPKPVKKSAPKPIIAPDSPNPPYTIVLVPPVIQRSPDWTPKP
jgi:hypothetical protein